MRTWADIRFEALAANLAALKKRLAPGGGLLLPVKADAYGHGAAQISLWAEELGVGWLGVASLDEATSIRRAGVRARLLLFGPLPDVGLAELVAWRVTPTLCSVDDALRWARAAPGVPAHVEIDTGMGRGGFDWRRVTEVARLAGIAGLVCEAAYTHFAAAETEPAFTIAQDERFRRLLADLAGRGLRFPMVHLSNSAALLLHPGRPEDLARPGIAVYGALRETGVRPDVAREFRPVLEWWAPVVQVREFLPGDTVGYGRTARIETPTRAALLGVGYGDGYPRSQVASGFVLLGGERCPLLGRVSMDLVMVDVGRAGAVREGDAALLVGEAPGLSAEEVAARSGTISYELLTGIRSRVERRYLRGAGGRERAEPLARGAVQTA
jgi:alanine racemase